MPGQTGSMTCTLRGLIYTISWGNLLKIRRVPLHSSCDLTISWGNLLKIRRVPLHSSCDLTISWGNLLKIRRVPLHSACDLYILSSNMAQPDGTLSLPPSLQLRNSVLMHYDSPEEVTIMVAMLTTMYTLYLKGLSIWISFPCFKSCRAINRPMLGSPPPPHPRIPAPMARHSTS